MEKAEFKERFLAYFKKLGIDDNIAQAEWEAYEGDLYEKGDDKPEFAVDECLSYWEE